MRALLLITLVACDGRGSADDEAPADADVPVDPTPNKAREITDTQLHFDVGAKSGSATITFGPGDAGASLEIGDLTIDTVMRGGTALPFAIAGKQLDLGLPASSAPRAVDIAWHYKLHEDFDGASMYGYTFLWPYHCGNLFPCHSQPSDGTTFTLDLQGVPADKTAIYPASIAADAPSYQVAWSIAKYTELPLGTTSAGTKLSVWYMPNELAAAQAGTAHLVAAFDWLEKTIGSYRFGTRAGTVSVPWQGGGYGGQEHHPFWHVGNQSLADEDTNVHEAVHGWFGDGVRIACWEDLVLSEGTVTYLTGRALEVVAPTVGAQVWQSYASELGSVSGADLVWPQSCGVVDPNNLWTLAPYMRGAFFYRGVAQKVGAARLDEALATFYRAHAGGSAGMAEMLTTIQTVTGYDPAACAQIWLRNATPPPPAPCP